MKLSNIFESTGHEQFVPYINKYFKGTKVSLAGDLYKLTGCEYEKENNIIQVTCAQINNGSYDGNYLWWGFVANQIADSFNIRGMKWKFLQNKDRDYDIFVVYIGFHEPTSNDKNDDGIKLFSTIENLREYGYLS